MVKSEKYSFLYLQKKKYKKYSIVPLRKKDIQHIRKWRNEQIIFLRQKKILTVNQQKYYYEKMIKPSFYANKPKIILLSFLYEDICIGYGGLVHIDWKSKKAEVSFVNDTKRSKTKYTYQKDFTFFLKLLFEIVFDIMKFNKLTTETFDIRPWTLEALEKNGFRKEGKLHDHIKINDKLYDALLHAKFKKPKNQ